MFVSKAQNGSINNASTSTCQEFGPHEVEQIIIAKVTVSCAAVVMCMVAITIIIALKLYRAFVQRLILYLMIVGSFYGVIIGLEIAPIHHDGHQAVVRDGYGFRIFCSGVALVSQVLVWQFMLLFAWIILYLFLLTIFQYRANSKKQEIAGIAVCLGFPLTFNWIPLMQGMYGLSGLWCWIRNTDGGCHHNYELGLIYQFTIFYGPLMVFILFSFVSFLAIVIAVCIKRARNIYYVGGGQQPAYQQALKEALPLLIHPVIYNIIALFMISNRVYYAITTKHNEKPYFPLWLAHALADPMQVLVVPVAFLLHPATVRQLVQRRRNFREPSEGAAYVISQEFSQSEEDPLVIKSKSNSTRRKNRGYQGILVDNQEQ